MKLIEKESEFYLLSNDSLQTGNLALRPDGVILKMTDMDMLHYLESESTATQKIIASTKKHSGLFALNLLNIKALLPTLDNKAFKYAYSFVDIFEPKQDYIKNGYKSGYNECLKDNSGKEFTKKEMYSFANWRVSRTRLFPNETIEESLTDFMLRGCKTHLEWEVEVEMDWNPIGLYCDECGSGGIYLQKPCDNICKNHKLKITDGFINIINIK